MRTAKFLNLLLPTLLCLLLCACAPEKPPPEVKTPRQVLEEQVIDDTHDAFLVDTGGALGELLVTVEWDTEGAREEFQALLHFAVWDPVDLSAPLQTMQEPSNVFHWSTVVDANFDGYQDFGYMYAMGNQPEYWLFWLWDEGEGRFRLEPGLGEISCPQFQEDARTIRGWTRSSALGTGVYTIHQWVEGELVCVRCIESWWDMAGGVTLTVTDRVDGEPVEVLRMEFPEESGGWLDEETKWHDLDYHGSEEEPPPEDGAVTILP